MVLTRRAYKEISRWLPNEVLVQIVQHSLKADQATLARVSQLFHEFSLPVLYRVIKLKDSNAITSFCSVIINNPPRAGAVRCFTLDVPHKSFHNRVEIRYDMILGSLKLMLKLDHLSLSGPSLDTSHTAMLLEQCNFTQLINCDLWAPSKLEDLLHIPPLLSKSSDLTAVFLTRHSTLKRIHIHSVHRMVASRSVHAPLPNLEFYQGHATFLPAVHAIGLKAVELVWCSEDDEEIDKIVTRLSSMTRPNSPFVSSHRSRHWNDLCQVATSVSKHMRHTKILRLQCLERSFTILSKDTIRRITGCLDRFTALVYLDVGCMINFQTPEVNNETQIAVEAWGEACLTLEACCLNFSAWRKIDSSWETFPMKEFRVLAGLSKPGS
ncbi:hypothetical protein C8R45DRAFT_395771 [Mycena sanguinolenta]|nr:hypothetical protein C8R45DRAFT_395771 [Mycena sanguinolenta]